MCLAIPARVVALPEPDAALIDVGGVRKRVSLAHAADVDQRGAGFGKRDHARRNRETHVC